MGICEDDMSLVVTTFEAHDQTGTGKKFVGDLGGTIRSAA
jgi:hypothetical protein